MAKWLGLVVQGGQGYRVELPTEAQWEYACRAGRTTPFTFHKGHKGQKCTPDVCNFHGDFLFPEGVRLTKRARVVKYRGFTIPVDGLPENLWGFFQMHGNVWEWCLDWYEGSFYKKVKGTLENPWNDEPALARVLRGGSWGDDGRDCRSARRYRYAPRARYLNVGFRLAAVPAVGAEQGKAGSGA
jgi:formylglycine-generating enzyme required for sulfatase activity